MLQIFGQVMKLPLTVFVSSIEMFVKTMQVIQRITDQGIDTIVSRSAQPLGRASDSGGDLISSATDGAIRDGAETTHQTPQKEESRMADLDLGGNDLKYVSYSILFKKYDFEATLLPETQELVDYPTDGASYGALKLVDFFAQVSQGKVPRPNQWKDPDNPYPPGAEGDYFNEIPQDDRKYVMFIYEVDRRIAKSDSDYEKRTTQAIERISRSLG